jgi:hypothetical protein
MVRFRQTHRGISRPRGRPRKPATEHAFNFLPYLDIAMEVAKAHVAKVKASGVNRPDWVWADLWEELWHIAAWDMMPALARRFDGRGTPEGFLRKYLPNRCVTAFYNATAKALTESGHLSYDEVFADL